MRTLAELSVEYHGLMLLVYYTVHLLGLTEKPATATTTASVDYSSSPITQLTPPPSLTAPLLRALSSLHKSHTCWHAIPLIYDCMAALGGVGYLLNDESQHVNVARLFRDACVGAIWEGTTDVLAGDTLRAVKHPGGSGRQTMEGLGWFVGAGLGMVVGEEGQQSVKEVEGVRAAWEGLKGRIEKGTLEELLPEARGIVFRMAEVLIAVLYMVDAAVNPGEEIQEMCRRYLEKRGFMVGVEARGRKDLATDQAIVYGAGKAPGQEAAAGPRL